MGEKGYIMQIQPFSVNDGDGIRTTIFMAGCPMRCKWCSNPEGFTRMPLVGMYNRKCIACGACAEVCPAGIGIDLNAERSGASGHGPCDACGRCVAACKRGARSFMVQEVDADDIVKDVEKHRLFYAYSGGGITFSGGEATSQPKFLNYLTKRLYDLGYGLAIETCGHFEFESVKESLERMDLIFMDLKVLDDEKHIKFTGLSNQKTLGNMALLGSLAGDVVIRIPVIGGVSDDEDNIRHSAAFVKRVLPAARIELLPYHKLGIIKYEALGIEYPGAEFYRPDEDRMRMLGGIVRSEGVALADFR